MGELFKNLPYIRIEYECASQFITIATYLIIMILTKFQTIFTNTLYWCFSYFSVARLENFVHLHKDNLNVLLQNFIFLKLQPLDFWIFPLMPSQIHENYFMEKKYFPISHERLCLLWPGLMHYSTFIVPCIASYMYDLGFQIRVGTTNINKLPWDPFFVFRPYCFYL